MRNLNALINDTKPRILRDATNLDIDEIATYIGKEELRHLEIKNFQSLDKLLWLAVENEMVRRGIKPPEWNWVANCVHCGEVPADIPAGNVLGCPWCFTESHDHTRARNLSRRIT